GSCDATDVGLTPELAFSPDFASNARHLGGERVELIDHSIDRVLQLEDFATRVDCNFRCQIAFRNRSGNASDIADLIGKIRSHGVHGICEIFPGSGDAAHIGLATELTFCADLASDTSYFGSERRKL